MNFKAMKMKLRKILEVRKLNESSIKSLRKLGFVVIEGGKHYKIFWGDSREFATVSKTLSDSNHGVDNLVSSIMRIVREVSENLK